MSLAVSVLMLAQATAPLAGGPAQGMTVSRRVEGDGGWAMMYFRPSAPNSSPVAANLRPALDYLLAHPRTPIGPDGAMFVTDSETSQFCPATAKVVCEAEQQKMSLIVPDGQRPNSPYLMPDGRVRIEWSSGAEVGYLTFVTFNGERVASVRTFPAVIPFKSVPHG